MTTKAIGLRVTLAKCASDLQGGTRPSEDLAALDQYIYPLWCELEAARGRKRKMVSAHYSLRIMCHLPFKMHMYFISALRCHKLNAKGPLI